MIILALCHFLSGKTCVLYTLDLSWNNIGEQGAVHFSNALPSNNTLINLDLASNSLGDYGGQKLTSSIGLSKSLVYVNLAQNSLMDCTAFVVSQVITL